MLAAGIALFKVVLLLGVLTGFVLVVLMLTGAPEMLVVSILPVFVLLSALMILAFLIMISSGEQPSSRFPEDVKNSVPGAFVEVPLIRAVLKTESWDRAREHGGTVFDLVHFKETVRPNASGFAESSFDEKKQAPLFARSVLEVEDVSPLFLGPQGAPFVKLPTKRREGRETASALRNAYLKDSYGSWRKVVDLDFRNPIFDPGRREELRQAIQPVSPGGVVDVCGRYTGHDKGGKRHRTGKPCKPVHTQSLRNPDDAEVTYA